MPASTSEYQILKTIGSGSFGLCKKIQRKKDGKIFVWKELDYGTMSESSKQSVVSEVNLLREMNHPHIVRYYSHIIDRPSAKLFIIMEFCEGGDLGSMINQKKKDGSRIEEDYVWKVCCQIVEALKECHSRSRGGKKILHRDLKPANVFLDKDLNVKLGDFGLARELSPEASFAQTCCGTPLYMSPELMNNEAYNDKSDVWSLGCLVYEMCALKPPFSASSMPELTRKIISGRFPRIPFRYSDELNDFIVFILQVEQRKRPTVSEVEAHPIFEVFNLRFGLDSVQIAGSTSASSDEGYSSRMETLARREQTLADRELTLNQMEKQLKQKEKSIQNREKAITLRENILTKLIDDTRTEEPRAPAGRVVKPDVRQSMDDSLLMGSLRSSFANKSRPGLVKKQVSFSIEKENDIYGMELPIRDSYSQKIVQPFKAFGVKESKGQMDEYTRNIMDIQQRLKLARRRASEFRSSPDISSRVIGYR